MPIDIRAVLERELTPQQRAAVNDPAREVLCLACAGSGKSRTLAYRIARLLAEDQPPEGIVAFTFTDRAADSIKRRVASALSAVGISPNVLGAMYIGTIHSYCQHILGAIDATYRQFDVLDENRLKLYIISRYWQLGLAALRPRARGNSYFDSVKQLGNAWKLLNDEMLTVALVTAQDPELGNVLERLSDSLVRDQYIDFSLMVRLVADALGRGDGSARSAVRGLSHLMVDEYQDVSPSQEALIRQLHQISTSLFVVGDDDQSIYAWRGADVSNILTFRARYPQASSLTLSENFRSTAAIVSASDLFVAAELGASRIAKNPTAVADRNPRDVRVLWFDDRDSEAAWIAERISALLGTAYEEPDGSVRGLTPADFAILMRSTRESEGEDGPPRHAAYTRALANQQVRFSLEAGGGPFDRPQVAALRSAFGFLRDGTPTREVLAEQFRAVLQPAYPAANFDDVARVFTEWGRVIHTPPGGARRRVYPQQLVYDLLAALRVAQSGFSDEVLRDIGLFSLMIQDVESVYVSVDSAGRFREILNFLGNVAETGYDVSTDDVLQRPNAVTVSTVHKAKGLEYPVVFVVDVEAQRFPARRGSYEGWLPPAVVQGALNRGAYQKNRSEEARLFYTAVTRAERFLYVTGAEWLPGGKKARKSSEFARRLVHPEISADANGMPADLAQSPPRQRIDETILPTTFSQIRYYLRCPMDYRFRQGFGFTPPIPDLFGFGKTVHTAVEKIHEIYNAAAPTPAQAEEVARQVFHLKHVPQSGNPANPGPYERARDSAVRIARNYAETYSPDFQRSRRVEARFEIAAKECVIAGSIDLLLREDETGQILDAEVVDFKAIEGEDDPENNYDLDWSELSLQVQLYARAARDVLGEQARTGSVHFLKDNQRVAVPVTDDAVQAAFSNIEWAVQGIVAGDFPARPHPDKCRDCDFNRICPQQFQSFRFSPDPPPEIHVPARRMLARAFSQATR
jgi:DNA helicase II / ATP-dependent DNA helicase PcrA